MKHFPLLLAGGIALGVTGCTMTPTYHRPAAPVATQWPDGVPMAQGQPAAPAPSAAELGWRNFITDAQLQQVIGLALQNNRDLRLATQNVELARALYGIKRD